MKKLTFKREAKETGLGSVAAPYADVTIKRGGKIVGMIAAPSRFGEKKWAPRFMVKNGDGWRWVFLRNKSDTEKEAREWITRNAEAIQNTYDLYEIDD